MAPRDPEGRERGRPGSRDDQTDPSPAVALRRTVASIPWLRALAAGIGAFLVGFAIVAGLAYLETTVFVDEADGGPAGVEVEDDDRLTWVAFIFYGAQQVDVRAGATPIEVFEIFTSGTTVPPVVWRLVPIAALVAGGYLLARSTLATDGWAAGEPDGPPARRLLAGATIGATVAVGYLLAAAAGTRLFTLGPWAIPPGRAILVVGLAYPLAFGAAGGLIAGWRRGRTG